MSKSKKKKNTTLSFVTTPGSAMDISDIVKSQNSSEELDLDEDLNEELEDIQAASIEEENEGTPEELTLEEEIQALKAEFDADPALKKDVLADFEANESDINLDNIASSISDQERDQMAHFEEVAAEVTEEMKMMNAEFINEDKMLESQIAEEAAQALLSEMTGSDEVEIEELSEQDQELRAALPHANEDGSYDLEDLQSCIEALLFYSDRPVSLKKLKEMLEMSEVEDAPILTAIEDLKAVFAETKHGFELCEIAGGYQLRTKVSKAPLLRKLAKVQVQRLSRGAMETLTIVAYKQPCTKDDIDKVRGVDSSHFIRTLMDRKLIEITGRAEAMGRPMVYATTDTFLEVFGLMDLKAMPPLREIEAMVPQLAATEEGGEDPRVVQMRKLVGQMKTESNALDYSAKEDDKLLQEIRDRVKSIDITSPYLERQKELAAQGIVGVEAEEILMKEMGFVSNVTGETASTQSELALSMESGPSTDVIDMHELVEQVEEEVASHEHTPDAAE